MQPPPPDPNIPAPPPKKQGFFSHQAPATGPDISGITSDVNSLSRRLRLLEEGLGNMKKFFQVNEENMISKHKHYSSEIKTITSDIFDIRKEVMQIKEKFVLVVKELQNLARKDDVKVLERYINLWNPVKFVSQNEIEGIIDDVLEKREKNKKEEPSKS
jgi:hypothetical protein